jgi:hypothetical protein
MKEIALRGLQIAISPTQLFRAIRNECMIVELDEMSRDSLATLPGETHHDL